AHPEPDEQEQALRGFERRQLEIELAGEGANRQRDHQADGKREQTAWRNQTAQQGARSAMLNHSSLLEIVHERPAGTVCLSSRWVRRMELKNRCCRSAGGRFPPFPVGGERRTIAEGRDRNKVIR